MTSTWRQHARTTFPPGTTVDDIRAAGTIDKTHVGEHDGCYVYLATFPKYGLDKITGQNVRIYLRDVLGIPNIGAGVDEERIYIRDDL